jgi:hypothetical protein
MNYGGQESPKLKIVGVNYMTEKQIEARNSLPDELKPIFIDKR